MSGKSIERTGAGVGGPGQETYTTERLDHLGIVAGVCREIGLGEWLDAQDEQSHERVGVGIATVAMILNGLGFSNRRLYLVPQFFATKAVERLLGPGITAEDLNDDCLGRALDWLYAHDPTTLFAGIALRARRAFGITARQVYVDTTSLFILRRIVHLYQLTVRTVGLYTEIYEDLAEPKDRSTIIANPRQRALCYKANCQR
jgi:Domain of unknown function (DUF4277)